MILQVNLQFYTQQINIILREGAQNIQGVKILIVKLLAPFILDKQECVSIIQSWEWYMIPAWFAP